MSNLVDTFRIGCLFPQVHWKAVLQPVFASANYATYLATWLSKSQAIWVSPANAHGAWDRVSEKEGSALNNMPLDPRQQRLQTLLLRHPQQTIPVLWIVAMLFLTMGHQSACMREPLAAQPAHDRRRCNRQLGNSGFESGLFSTIYLSCKKCRELVGSQLRGLTNLLCR